MALGSAQLGSTLLGASSSSSSTSFDVLLAGDGGVGISQSGLNLVDPPVTLYGSGSLSAVARAGLLSGAGVLSATAVTGLPGTPYSTAVLNDTPTFYLRMNESSGNPWSTRPNASDTMAYLSLANGAALTNASPVTSASTDRAVAFTGGTNCYGDVINATANAEYNPLGSATDLTLECWLKTSAAIGYEAGLIDTGNSQAYLHLVTSGAVKACAAGGATITSTRVVNDGVWHHIVFTRVGATGAQTLYIDGTSDASGTGATGAIGNNGQMRVGSIVYVGNQLPASDVAEIATYTTALSSARVAAHYSAATTFTTLLSGSATLQPDRQESPYEQVVLGQSPSAYYPYNQPSFPLLDATGHGYDITSGSTGWSLAGGMLRQQTAGQAVDAMMVTSGQWMALPSAVSPAGQTAFTYSLWNNACDNGGFGSVSRLLSAGNSGNSGFYLDINSGDGRFYAFIGDGTTSLTLTSAQAVGGSQNHAAITWDGQTLALYVNGTLSASTTAASPLGPISTPDPLNVGRSPTGMGTYDAYGYYGNGQIQGLGAWMGTALTPAQIQSQYLAGLAGVGLSGSGSLTANALPKATLMGVGTLSAAPTIHDNGSAALAGSGTLSVSSSYAVYDAATLSGNGALTAVGVSGNFGSATLVGHGDLGPLAALPLIGAGASLAGIGNLSATSTLDIPGTVALGGTGVFSIGTTGTLGESALGGSASLASSAMALVSSGSALMGTAALDVVMPPPFTVALSGVGDLYSSTSVGLYPGTIALSGGGALAAAGGVPYYPRPLGWQLLGWDRLGDGEGPREARYSQALLLTASLLAPGAVGLTLSAGLQQRGALGLALSATIAPAVLAYSVNGVTAFPKPQRITYTEEPVVAEDTRGVSRKQGWRSMQWQYDVETDSEIAALMQLYTPSNPVVLLVYQTEEGLWAQQYASLEPPTLGTRVSPSVHQQVALTFSHIGQYA